MTVAADTPLSARKTLTICGGAHALHDGFTDLLNVLYPLLQAQFGLSYAAIGALKSVYSAAMASGQIPSSWLAGRIGGVAVLAGGTALIAVGYGIAGLTGSLYGVVVGLLLAGLGGVLGCLLVLPLNGITTGIGNSNFSETAFNFHVSPQIMLTGIAFAMILGAVGGLFPASNAARKEILTALRQV